MKNMQTIIIAMKGHPGSGKSTLANSIASSLKCPIIDKDHFRDSTKPIQEFLTNSSPSTTQDITKLLNDLSYQAMYRVVLAQLDNGLDNIVVDSPLSRKAHLDHLMDIAYRTNAKVVVVECRAEDEGEWRRRVAPRGGGWHKPRTWHEMEKLLEGYQGCWEYDVGDVPKVVVDTTTSGTVEDLVSIVLEFVESKRAC
ncbi:hypothetical protein LIER_04697 [Lithospermum erythrorhizon]|uniref:P-loop containing nucleoside triphosphate hydrolase n=1 Tax=Lithospermum erythrorhizon TaxID=34254 RepID=A0AAV3P2D6_LITER